MQDNVASAIAIGNVVSSALNTLWNIYFVGLGAIVAAITAARVNGKLTDEYAKTAGVIVAWIFIGASCYFINEKDDQINAVIDYVARHNDDLARLVIPMRVKGGAVAFHGVSAIVILLWICVPWPEWFRGEPKGSEEASRQGSDLARASDGQPGGGDRA